MPQILDGRAVQAEIKKELAAAFSAGRPQPHLAIVQVGERPESTLYIKCKKDFAKAIGVAVTHQRYPETISQDELILAIQNFNQDKLVHGIIVQIPLPEHLSPPAILNSIAAEKDVDGLAAVNLQAAWHNKPGFRPATARAVMTLLEYYHIPVTGRRVTVVGRSALVGEPIALACLNAGATVTICHRRSINLVEATQQADILIVAVGSPNLITPIYVHGEQTVIDVGINVISGQKLLEEVGGRKLVGDVDFDQVATKVAAISPVPGGVGPLTISSLFQNLLEAYKQSARK